MQKLTEYDCRVLLKKYKIKLPRAELARSEDEAVKYAERIGYPVVLKLISADMLHKTDVGGVIINIDDAEGVRKSYGKIHSNAREHGNINVDGILVEETLCGRQVIVGSVQDPQFGPVLMFGIGGIFVELLHDVSFRVIPITRHDAEKMILEIKAHDVLSGVRGQKAVNLRVLADTLVKISNMVEKERDIVELDINPLFVNEKVAVAGDARIVMG
ncbi:MAG: acetyl-CoA synthetase [Candidatus Nanohalarchaeota archaeon]|nr:MAG: acetyl-CoA synthetase [Candidatus Nanohaloarchaeota archaeon]